MYISELHIDGFGPASGIRCRFEGQVTVVYGPNEAGKSTLLRFIRTMLYGFATRAQLPERGEPVNGGRHGGRLIFRDDGRERILERYADIAIKRGGAVAVLREEDGSERGLTQAEVERLLLGGVSERLFKQLFAVTLDELHELRTLQGEEIGNYLYNTGMAGGAALTSAGKQLTAEMDRLYRPRGTTQEINRLLEDMRVLEAELRQSRQRLEEYQETLRHWEEAGQSVKMLEEALPRLREQAAFLQGACDSRVWWLSVHRLEQEEAELLAELPDSSQAGMKLLGKEAAWSWRIALERRAQGITANKQTESELAQLQLSRMQVTWDKQLLAVKPQLEALEARREAVQARREELSAVKADLRVLAETTAGTLQRLSPWWEEADAKAFATISEREEARRIAQLLTEAERRRGRLEEEAQRLRRDLYTLNQLAEESDAELALKQISAATSLPQGVLAFVPTKRDGLLQAWHRLEDALRELDGACREVSWTLSAWASAGGISSERIHSDDPSARPAASRSRKSSAATAGGKTRLYHRGLLIGSGIALVAAIGAGLAALAQHGQAQGVLFLLAALLACVAVGAIGFAVRMGRGERQHQASSGFNPELTARMEAAQLTLQSRMSQVHTALGQLLVQPETMAASLSIAGSGADTIKLSQLQGEIDQVRRTLRDAVDQQLEAYQAEDQGHARMQEHQRRQQEVVQELDAVEAELADAEIRMDTGFVQWKAWLTARRLPVQLLPASLPELAQLAEQALQLYRQCARLEARVGELGAELAAFEADAAALFAACPPPAHAALDAALAVKLLYREAQQQQETAAEARRLDERLRLAEAAAAETRAGLAAADAEIAAALAEAGAASEADYALRLRVDERRAVLLRERREAELQLAAGRDAEGVAELQALLGTHDEAALALLHEDALQMLAAREAERAAQLDKRGRLSAQLERLRELAESEDRMLALEEQQAELDRLADRYALLALTAELIRQTKVKFEEERQPEVLLAASSYFNRMTAGRYSKIVAPGESSTLLAETPDRRFIDSAFLSRGTQEQMYLALRLALASATSTDHPLPILLDDLFVHFDADRLQRCVKVLEEVAASRQIILFTCHDHVREAVLAGLPQAGVIRLPE